MNIGTEVYYTGDMANHPGRGVITETRHGQLKVTIPATSCGFCDEPCEHGIEQRDLWAHPLSFAPGPGRRFWVWEEHCDHRRQQFEDTLRGLPQQLTEEQIAESLARFDGNSA